MSLARPDAAPQSRGAIRVLLLCRSFAPHGSAGAIRVTQFAKSLVDAGMRVTVVAADQRGEQIALPAGLESLRRYRSAVAEAASFSAIATRAHGFRSRRLLKPLLVPDASVRDVLSIARSVKESIEDSQPEVVVASSPPATVLCVAAHFARKQGVPWIADLRDLWTENPTYAFGPGRRRLDAVIESRTLRSASDIVTVSDDWARRLAGHGPRVTVIRNGFAEELYTEARNTPVAADARQIAHIGTLYHLEPGFSTLRDGLRTHLAAHRDNTLLMIGGGPTSRFLAGWDAAVLERVEVRPRLSQIDATRATLTAGVLVAILWGDPGWVPAKIYDYLASGRPIVAIGDPRSEAAELLRRHGRQVWIGQTLAEFKIAMSKALDAARQTEIDPMPTALSRDEAARCLVQVVEAAARRSGTS